MKWKGIHSLLFGLLVAWAGLVGQACAEVVAGPWDMVLLKQAPEASWTYNSARQVYAVYYESVPYQGHPTRVFGYYAVPSVGSPPYPTLVLVHGVTQHAYADWALHWAGRGYAALALDLTGEDPAGRMADAGPEYYSGALFQTFDDRTLRDTWVYHAVAAVVRGVSLVWHRAEVDRARIGVHGVSMGGVITSTVVGIDDRVSLAVPVYGSGYLAMDRVVMTSSLFAQPCEQRQSWLRTFDPSCYLPNATAPMLFVSGATDIFFSPPCYQRSQQAVSAPVTVSLRTSMDHGPVWLMPHFEQEIQRFVDAQFLGGTPLPRLGESKRSGTSVSAAYTSPVSIQKAELLYTMDLGPWKDRRWQSSPAVVGAGSIEAVLPDFRPLVYYLGITDQKGAFVSNPLVVAGTEGGLGLRMTGVTLRREGGLEVMAVKPWGHSIVLQASGSFEPCGWANVATNDGSGESLVFKIPEQPVESEVLYRLEDLSW